MDAIRRFYNMGTPHQDGSGQEESWCSCGDGGHSVMYYLLNDGSNLLGDLDTASMEDVKKYFYFNTELDCHQALFKYYMAHSQQYSHIGRYNELLDEADASNDEQDVVCSETMKFI